MRALIMLALAACADPAPPCQLSTRYLGAEHDCADGAGVCIEGSCMQKCFADPSTACGEGFMWATQATVDAEVCYCVVQP